MWSVWSAWTVRVVCVRKAHLLVFLFALFAELGEFFDFVFDLAHDGLLDERTLTPPRVPADGDVCPCRDDLVELDPADAAWLLEQYEVAGAESAGAAAEAVAGAEG